MANTSTAPAPAARDAKPPASGFTSALLARGSGAAGVEVHVEGPAQVVFTASTIEPGGSTGWHWHPGPVLVAVRSGTLTRYDASGDMHTHGPGASLVEPAGEGHVHLGANHGREPVVLVVAYIVPAGAPLRTEADRPCP